MFNKTIILNQINMNELKKFLLINSFFSIACGTIMLFFSIKLNSFFNINNEFIFQVIGLSLIFFSILVYYVSLKHLRNKLLVNIISLLDAVWVIGSLIIILFDLFNLSNNGKIIIGLVAVWIAFLGYKQFKNNQK